MEEPFIVSQLFSMQKKKKTFYLALCVPVAIENQAIVSHWECD